MLQSNFNRKDVLAYEALVQIVHRILELSPSLVNRRAATWERNPSLESYAKAMTVSSELNLINDQRIACVRLWFV